MTAIHLIRHAKAKNRLEWSEPDELRPLTKRGRREASAVAERLASDELARLVSSPYVRCVQTLEPLAERVGLPIEVDARLGEGAAFEGVLELLDALPRGAVLCSHGDVIPETIDALIRRGLDVRSAPDWRKASVWVLKRKHGHFTQAVVWGPPGT